MCDFFEKKCLKTGAYYLIDLNYGINILLVYLKKYMLSIRIQKNIKCMMREFHNDFLFFNLNKKLVSTSVEKNKMLPITTLLYQQLILEIIYLLSKYYYLILKNPASKLYYSLVLLTI